MRPTRFFTIAIAAAIVAALVVEEWRLRIARAAAIEQPSSANAGGTTFGL